VQHVAGRGRDRDQRVIAAHVVVGEARPTLFLQPIGLADGGVEVDRDRIVAGPGTRAPGTRQELACDLVELARVTEGEGAQKRPQRRRRRDSMT